MSVELQRPPMAVFHFPGIHPGMSYLAPRPGWVLRQVEGAAVRLFAESDEPTVRDMQRSAIERQERRLLTTVMEINASPVVLENAQFRNAFGMIDGRIWLNGAAGNRMRNKFDQQNTEEWRQGRLVSAFRRGRKEAALPLPVWKDRAADLPVAIELKNGFNYYHFTTETLGCLASFVQDDGDQPINLHLPQDNLRGFLTGFIEAVFPRLAPRVRFVSSACRYDRVRALYSHQHYLYQVEDPRVQAAVNQPGVDPRWNTLRSEAPYRKAVAMASYDSSLRLLREHALRRVPRKLVEKMPRLVWMGRDEGGAARLRGMTGQARLMAGLAERGFHCVAFEHLSPIEQIAQMQAADILVAPHGAGLANMVYAKTGALVIEIATRQTQMHRWGDFLPCAHVSRCRYDTVFADVAGVSRLDAIPPVSEGLVGIHVGRRATRRILALVDDALAGLPAQASAV
ncbi:glycosyltransferase family 61 protein [Paracoccus sp. MA]|uniref:glycosyltransferase 61 family protein n=1 Tax=Paracoccus sp. MA TaxID=2895796 RepID=UPI001E62E8D4|nr:glycosyltransferase family 61 protein [Paracoccus sp. MA]UFM65263.1 glycosyltransferase family 61 protein [Paracoccus sp. MA]